MRAYFDNAATTPIDPEVLEEIVHVMQTTFGNPSSIHAEGRKARAVIEEARRKIAGMLNASIGEIYFTSGGTESNNMALKCAVRDLGVKRIISSPTEHHCTLHSLENIEVAGLAEVIYLRIDQQGKPDLEQLEELLRQEHSPKTLVSLMHANNETGTMINLSDIAALCQEHRAYFHTDTVQTMGYYPIDVSELPISFLSGSAHKLHGPKGTGFIYINGENNVAPLIHGGAQERNMRAGTENIYGIVGLAKAMELSQEHMSERESHIRSCRQHLINRLKAEMPDVQINGDAENGHYKVLSLAIPPSPKSDFLVLHLDIAGICASGGSACSSGAEKPSHVLQAMRLDPQYKPIRISFSHHNTIEEIDYLVEKLKEALLIPESV